MSKNTHPEQLEVFRPSLLGQSEQAGARTPDLSLLTETSALFGPVEVRPRQQVVHVGVPPTSVRPAIGQCSRLRLRDRPFGWAEGETQLQSEKVVSGEIKGTD